MRRFSQDFTGLGLLINLLVLIGFVVLMAKAFTPGAKTPAPAVANAAVLPTATPVPDAATPTAVPPTIAPTATALPPAADSVVVTETVASTTTTAAAPAADAAAAPVDVEAVTAIVTKGTCNACHVIPGIAGAVGIVGPNLSNIGAEAGTRIPGYTAEQYLHESLVDPNAFVAPKCPFGSCTPGSMPNTLAQTLTPEELQTMINYLLTLQTPP